MAQTAQRLLGFGAGARRKMQAHGTSGPGRMV
jgi:hypothetical protein